MVIFGGQHFLHVYKLCCFTELLVQFLQSMETHHVTMETHHATMETHHVTMETHHVTMETHHVTMETIKQNPCSSALKEKVKVDHSPTRTSLVSFSSAVTLRSSCYERERRREGGIGCDNR